MIVGIGHLLSAAPELPSLAERVRLVLRDIDPADPAIAIWVPGTSEHHIDPQFLNAASKRLPGLHVTMIPYEATWRLSTSVPDGAAVLRGVIEGLRKRGDRRPILLAGESQGAWVISSVMSDRKMAREVTRAAIWGHPAAAPQHFGRKGTVREVNNPTDVISMSLGGQANSVVHNVEQISRLDIIRGVGGLAGFAVKRPDIVKALVSQWLWAFPVVGRGKVDPHKYSDDFEHGAAFLATGMGKQPTTPARARRARLQP